jgi:hypothetical protein
MVQFWRVIAVGAFALALPIGDAADASHARRRGKALNFHGIGYIAQVPSAAWRHRRVVNSREFESLYSGRADAPYRRGRRNQVSFTDALLEEPNPATRGILADLGIPAIDGVPPIAVLWGLDPHPRDAFFARHRLRR